MLTRFHAEEFGSVKPLDVPQIVPVIEASLVRSAKLKQLKLAEQNLNVALSRGAISMAIGLITERYRLPADEASEVLCQYARSQSRRLGQQIAGQSPELTVSPVTGRAGCVRIRPSSLQDGF